VICDIGGVPVGPGNPTYVIAEIGSNHDGSLDRATQLIDLAAEAGADAAKFQLFRPDELYPGQHIPGGIPDAWLPDLKSCCHEAGVEFICSVFSRETLDAYMAVSPAAVKIASPEATSVALVTAAAEAGVPLLVSTGAMTWQQTHALAAYSSRAPSRVFLHCVSAYPAERNELNLSVIREMCRRYWAVIGFSDHTLNAETVPPLAVAAGAAVLEKHFTYSRLAEGADHPFALEPDEFAAMVEAVRDVEVVLGDGVKQPTASEDPTDRRLAA
jgi:N,N'-diacetyllegionaminate synthase